MRTALFCTVLALSPWLAAQQTGETSSTDHRDHWIPASPGEEGPMRFATPDLVAWAGAQPVRPPPSRPVPKGFVNRGLSLDAQTGIERVRSLPVSPPMARFWVAGSAPPGQVSEPDSWNADLTAVNTPAFPWRAQCRVFVRMSGNVGYGSGTLIDARHVITAGQDYSGESAEVQAICAAVHTAEVIAAFEASQEGDAP